MSACNIWCEALCQSCWAKCRAVHLCDLLWRVLNILTSMGDQKLLERCDSQRCIWMSFSGITQPICLFANMRMRLKYQLSFFKIAFESLPTLRSVALIVSLYEHTLACFTFVSVFSVSLSILFSLFLQWYWLLWARWGCTECSCFILFSLFIHFSACFRARGSCVPVYMSTLKLMFYITGVFVYCCHFILRLIECTCTLCTPDTQPALHCLLPPDTPGRDLCPHF